MKSKLLFGVLRAVVVVAGIVVGISVSQSCSDKPSDEGDNDTLKPPPWLQTKVDFFAAWSPDGSKIIYTRDPAGSGKDTSWQFGGFIHDITTGKDTCIWPNVKFDGFSWSPDGQKVALTQNAQVWVYDFANGSKRQITHQNRNFSVSWSPCGDKLIFFYRTSTGGLFVYDFAVDSITHVPGRNEAASGDWMPDCSTLVLMDSCGPKVCDLFGYNLYTDSLWIIDRTPGYKGDLAVSPDGKAVVFTSQYQLWKVGTSGDEAMQLTTEGGGHPDWSPDGQWIVYTKVNFWNGYLWLMRPDGSEKHQITF